MNHQERIRESLENFLVAAENWDTAGYGAFFTEDAVKIDPNGSEPVAGRAAIVDRYQKKRVAKLDNWQIKRDDVFVSGNGAALRWTVDLKQKDGEMAKFNV